MKKCNYSHNKYWLCPYSERRPSDVWLNSGHPCRFSVGSWIGETECARERNTNQLPDIDENTLNIAKDSDRALSL